MEYHSGGSLPLLGRPRYCPGANANGGYLCETGHCCGETGCCTYYYELWWFWLLWTVLILFSCCCAYRHRRAKMRVQQQQRQREISLLAYHGANSYSSSMLDLSFLASLKLPSYEEVAAQPSTPPPPYSSVFTTPRYPQPPRTADPHLLTQHGPLLHRPLSDGPSSLSSDNSSSCSCDSCCPSSPCSSSLSAPVTYETDTSHATTPSEAAPLTLDVTMETISAAATCLEVNERMVPTVTVDIEDEDAATDSPVPGQVVSVAIVSTAVSPPHLPSPSSEAALPVVTTTPIKQQSDTAPSTSVPSTSHRSSLSSPSVVDTKPPSIQIIDTEGQANDPETPTAPRTTPASGASSPAADVPDGPAAQTLDLTRTSDPVSVSGHQTSALSPHVERTLTSGSAGLQTHDPNPALVPVLVPPNPTQTPTTEPPELTQASVPAPTNLILVPKPQSIPPTGLDSALSPPLPAQPEHPGHIAARDAAPTSPTSAHRQAPPGSDPVLDPASPSSSLLQHPGGAAVLSDPGPSVVLSPSSELDLLPNLQGGFGSGSGSGAPAPELSLPTPAASCPAITIEPEAPFALCQPPPALSPSSPQSLPSPPAVSSISLPAPALLLDPLTAHQSSKGGSSSGHASSLSPSPRATQSPPKQTLFSPCVDVFEPGPPSWEDEDEEPEEENNEEDEDEDMGADESQYRHRRLTGDSGIEVCRCRVEEEEEEEEEEDEEEGKSEEDGRRGGGGGGERDRKGGGNADLHDSVDCPARGQITTGEGLTLCNPASSTATPTPEDGGKVVVVIETV